MKSEIRDIILSSGLEFAAWLMDMEHYDYEKFDVNWLQYCDSKLIKSISENATIVKGINKAFKLNGIKGDTKTLSIYFDYFVPDV